jgi:hypothetical protein
MVGKLSLAILMSLGLFLETTQAETQRLKPIIIAVLDTGDGSPHQAKVVSTLRTLLRQCKSCRIETFPIYDKAGNLSEKIFLSALQLAASKSQIIHLSWNTSSNESTIKIEAELSKVAKDHVMVASAGSPEKEIAVPLAKTVMGKIPNALIVGEANSKGHLVSNSYYGPEMFTALTVPDAKNRGSSFSALRLTAAIANWLEKSHPKSLFEVFENLQKAKKKSFSDLPSLNELGLE